MRKGTGGGAVKRKETLRERGARVRKQVDDHRTGVGKRFVGDPLIDLSFENGFVMGYRAAQRDARKAKESK